MKVTVVMPAYNAARTLAACVAEIPRQVVDEVILVDDASQDATVALARQLGLEVVVHPRNRGYGGNQKTCYQHALERGADIVIMVHPDHQYDPKVIPLLVKPLQAGDADAVFGSRILGGKAREGGMPWWKYLGNLFLTRLENACFGLRLSEYHSGLRAYSRRYLEAVPFFRNSDKWVFDSEIIAQGALAGMRFAEIPIATRYFPEASQIGFFASVGYGFSILGLCLRFLLHRWGLWRQEQFRVRQGESSAGAKSSPKPESRRGSHWLALVFLALGLGEFLQWRKGPQQPPWAAQLAPLAGCPLPKGAVVQVLPPPHLRPEQRLWLLMELFWQKPQVRWQLPADGVPSPGWLLTAPGVTGNFGKGLWQGEAWRLWWVEPSPSP
jgi:glycosyltransferase involved in cell wall biosynthesis